MKKRLLKKTILTSIGAASATIPLISMVGCAKNQNTNRLGSEYDKEYGIDAAVYKKLKTTFLNKVINDPEHSLSDEEKIIAKKELKSAFNSFDAQFKKQNLSYTAVTNSMIEYAYRAYDIKLEREKVTRTVSWDELDAAFEGMCESMKAFMSDLPTEMQEAILTDAAKQYYGDGESKIKGLKNEISDKYADPLMGLITAKSKLWACFAGVNEDIALLAASIRLHDFLDNHEVFYDVKTSDNNINKYDNFSKQQWFKDALQNKDDISAHILDIFTITDKTTGEALTKFDSTKVCPGYVIKPMLKGVTADPITNKYSLNIDWTCMSNAYTHSSDESKLNATAHCFNKQNDAIDLSQIKNVHEYFAPLRESASIPYSVILSKHGEAEALSSTFFNKSASNYIDLDWNNDDSLNNSYEAFFFGDRLDDGLRSDYRQYKINSTNLAQTGIRVAAKSSQNNDANFIRLDDLIAVGRAQKISDLHEEESQENTSDFMRDFVTNCALSAISSINDIAEPTKNGGVSVTNNVYVNYSNTTYKFDKEIDLKVVSDDVRSCFGLTEVSYNYLTNQYNLHRDLLDVYTGHKYDEQYEDCKNGIIAESVMYGLNTLFTVLTTKFCWVPIFVAHLPIYMVLLGLTYLSQAAQTVSLAFSIKYKLDKIKEFKDGSAKLNNDSRLKVMDEFIKGIGGSYSICRYDTDAHTIASGKYNDGLIKYSGETVHFVSDILPTITELQNIRQSDKYNDFISATHEYKCSPDDYLKEMSPWDEDGWCTIASISLFLASMTLDIACIALMFFTPELADAEVVKNAKILSDMQGGGFKEFLKIYNVMKYMKSIKLGPENPARYLQGAFYWVDGTDSAEFASMFFRSFGGDGKPGFFLNELEKLDNVMGIQGKEFFKQWYFMERQGGSFEVWLNDFNKLAKAGKGFGFADLAKRFATNPACGSITKSGKSFLLNLCELLRDEVRTERLVGGEIANISIHEIKKWLVGDMRNALNTALGRAGQQFAQNAFREGFESLKQVDRILTNPKSYELGHFVGRRAAQDISSLTKAFKFTAEVYQQMMYDAQKALKNANFFILI